MIFSLTQFNQWSILKFNGCDKKTQIIQAPWNYHSKYFQVEIKPHWFSHRIKQFNNTFHFHPEIIPQSRSI